MNILFYLSRYPGWGGIETVTSLVIDELLLRGYTVDILSHSQQYEAQSIPSNVTLYEMPDEAALDTPENRAFAESVIKNKSYDLIIYQDCYEPSERLIVEVSKKCNIPFILFEHNTPLFLYNVKFLSKHPIKRLIKSILYPFFRRQYLKKERKRKRLLYDNCLKYVMLSENFIPEIAKRLRVSLSAPHKFCHIPNPINFNLARDSCKGKELLFVGRLVVEKQVDKVLRIWGNLQDKFPEWTLSIVGDGPLRSELESMANNENLQRVNFYGYQNSLQFFQRAAIFLMTSKYEGWGMTLVEAMSQECVPVVEKNFSSVTDIIDSGINGIILPEKSSVKIWCKTLSELMDNPIYLSSLAKEGPNKMKNFTVKRIVDKWEILLDSI